MNDYCSADASRLLETGLLVTFLADMNDYCSARFRPTERFIRRTCSSLDKPPKSYTYTLTLIGFDTKK